jgi:hypothetical protein
MNHPIRVMITDIGNHADHAYKDTKLVVHRRTSS